MSRKAIPKVAELELLEKCRRRCALCFGLSRDTSIKSGQIAHIDRDSSNAAIDNLVFLCLQHHDEYDSRRSQSKGLTDAEVHLFRRELEAAIQREWMQPIFFGKLVIPDEVNIFGRWIREGDDDDSAELELKEIVSGRVKVEGLALHGKTREYGPNLGQLDFEAATDGRTVRFVDALPGGESYRLTLNYDSVRLVAVEENAFGHFGVGAQFGGVYSRPRAV